MNIENLTIGEAKEIAGMFGGRSEAKSSIYDEYVGMYVLCRSKKEGVNAGKVVALDETGVILEDARRLYSSRPLDSGLSWYEGVAASGLSEDSKVSVTVKKIIVERYSLTICSEVAEKSIRGAESHEQG